MELSALDSVAPTGAVVSLAHKAAMQSSLPLLKKNYKFSKVLFFGKVQGSVGDYLIAIGIEESFQDKKFFFCTDGVSWGQLPPPTAEAKALCAKLPNGLPFKGDISHAYTIPMDPVPEGDEPPEEPPEPPKIFEDMRLAVLVSMLDEEAGLAPLGALRMLPTGAVGENGTYCGLGMSDVLAISNYVLANKLKPKNVLQPSMTNSMDFLMPADSVVPKGCLVTHSDEATGITTIRNLLWPGFVGYATAGSKTWGYCYFGTGEKNADIAFMLP